MSPPPAGRLKGEPHGEVGVTVGEGCGVGRGAGPPGTPEAVVLVVDGRIGSDDAAVLSGRARALLEEQGAAVLVCDVGTLTEPDVGTVDTLARLQLTARRLGRRLRLRGASPRLRELLSLTGLVDVVAPDPGDSCRGGGDRHRGDDRRLET